MKKFIAELPPKPLPLSYDQQRTTVRKQKIYRAQFTDLPPASF